VKAARHLVRALCDPQGIEVGDWNALISAARAEQLIGSLAARMEGRAVPPRVAAIFDAARRDSARQRTQALWEAEMARRALAPLGVPVVLLKGTAFHAAGLAPSEGRSVGDLDILVPRESLGAVEAALLAAGWEHVKAAGGYDDDYYRRWMHELPPLIHRDRDRMIDVHHTILPLTARSNPDAARMIADSVALENGLRVLCPEDMVVHAAAHLLADGDLAGGLRNLWDIDRLLRAFSTADPDFWAKLEQRARVHTLLSPVRRAARLANDLYGTPIPPGWRVRNGFDPLCKARLLARNGWGQAGRPLLRFGFYVRSHALRMPPLMLARHLWTKATG
jgi:hypothetical protein